MLGKCTNPEDVYGEPYVESKDLIYIKNGEYLFCFTPEELWYLLEKTYDIPASQNPYEYANIRPPLVIQPNSMSKLFSKQLRRPNWLYQLPFAQIVLNNTLREGYAKRINTYKVRLVESNVKVASSPSMVPSGVHDEIKNIYEVVPMDRALLCSEYKLECENENHFNGNPITMEYFLKNKLGENYIFKDSLNIVKELNVYNSSDIQALIIDDTVIEYLLIQDCPSFSELIIDEKSKVSTLHLFNVNSRFLKKYVFDNLIVGHDGNGRKNIDFGWFQYDSITVKTVEIERYNINDYPLGMTRLIAVQCGLEKMKLRNNLELLKLVECTNFPEIASNEFEIDAVILEKHYGGLDVLPFIPPLCVKNLSVMDRYLSKLVIHENMAGLSLINCEIQILDLTKARLSSCVLINSTIKYMLISNPENTNVLQEAFEKTEIVFLKQLPMLLRKDNMIAYQNYGEERLVLPEEKDVDEVFISMSWDLKTLVGSAQLWNLIEILDCVNLETAENINTKKLLIRKCVKLKNLVITSETRHLTIEQGDINFNWNLESVERLSIIHARLINFKPLASLQELVIENSSAHRYDFSGFIGLKKLVINNFSGSITGWPPQESVEIIVRENPIWVCKYPPLDNRISINPA